jgi:hypothetical protein
MDSSAGLPTSVKRITYSRIGRRRESAVRHRARFPRPNYHGRAVRPECERASRREVHGSCRPPSQRWHNQKAQARRARHCSATRLRRARRAATISIPAGMWHGRRSGPRCERVQIFPFRTFAIRREFQNASELFRVSAYVKPPPRNENWLRADLSRGKTTANSNSRSSPSPWHTWSARVAGSNRDRGGTSNKTHAGIPCP